MFEKGKDIFVSPCLNYDSLVQFVYFCFFFSCLFEDLSKQFCTKCQ